MQCGNVPATLRGYPVRTEDDVGRNGGALSRLYELDISHLRVGRVRYSSVPVPKAFSQDVEVVAVDVDGVGAESEEVLEYDTDGRVGAEVMDIPFSWEIEVVCINIL